MNFLIISCSIRPGGLSPRVVPLVQHALTDLGHRPVAFDLRALPFHGVTSPADYPAVVEEWRQAVATSDGVVWVTPTYHNTLPGVAKSALDLLDARVMRGKVNGIIGASNLTAEPGVIALGNVVRFIGGLLAFDDLYIPYLKDVWPRDTDPPSELVQRVNRWTEGFAATLSPTHSRT